MIGGFGGFLFFIVLFATFGMRADEDLEYLIYWGMFLAFAAAVCVF